MTRKNQYGYSDKYLNQELTSRIYAEYAAEGLTEWYAAGFKFLPVARMWRDAGFTPETASEWRPMAKASGLLPADCAEWRDAGFTPAETADWSRNWSPTAAQSIRAEGRTSRKQTTRAQALR